MGAAGYLYKPNTRKGPVVIVPNRLKSPPKIKLPDGTIVEAVPANQRGGTFQGHEGFQYVFPTSILGQQGATLDIDGTSVQLSSTNQRYQGSSASGMKPSNKDGGGIGGTGGPFDATQTGPGGVVPADLSALFPEAQLSEYDPIQAAPYTVIDPRLTMKEYSPLVSELMQKNFFDSKQYGLDVLDTELEGLQNFVPKVAELKRDTITLDNIFNQQQRTQQVETALPGMVSDLEQQAADARAYASGRAPDSITDAALELGVRSNAADVSAASGFGSTGVAGRKLSDLMSAERRIQLSEYGNSLLASNAAQRANLLLAPTSYSNAGEQISAMPSMSAGGVQLQQADQLNRATTIDAQTAFNASINQSQFATNLEQTTRQFNASNMLQNNQFNTTNINNFALSKFNYLVSLANSYAQAAQNSLNLGVALDQQQQARNEATKQRDRTARNQTAGQVAQTVGTAATVAAIFASDERLKTDVEDYKKGLQAVLDLRPVNYKYVHTIDPSQKLKTGIIAQEFELICPDSVYEIEGGYKAVDHTEIIFMLVNAIKELHSELKQRG